MRLTRSREAAKNPEDLLVPSHIRREHPGNIRQSGMTMVGIKDNSNAR